jgi:hypothetical protein
MENILYQAEYAEEQALSWSSLAIEAGIEVCSETVKRGMEERRWRKCIACKKRWVSEDLRKVRVEWAEYMLRHYSEPKDWHRVRFSDEAHMGIGPQGKLRIIRKAGERYCSNCIQDEREKPKDEGKYRIHVWGAIGLNFKSNLVKYDVEGNTNGKLSQQAYINQILTSEVLP